MQLNSSDHLGFFRWSPIRLSIGLLGVFLGCGAMAEAPVGFKVDGQAWSYEGDGLSLEGILLKPEGKGPFPAILISHGLGGNAKTFGISKAREFVKYGLVCIACNYTHAGGSGGARISTNDPESRKVLGASDENLRRARKSLDLVCSLPEVDSTMLYAYGHSMGGFVTIGLAASDPTRLKAAAVSGSGVAPQDGFPAPSLARAESIRTPFIMLHGADDNTVRPAQSQSLKEKLDALKIANERYIFEGLGHPVDQQRPDIVYPLIIRWFANFGLATNKPFENLPPASSSGSVTIPNSGEAVNVRPGAGNSARQRAGAGNNTGARAGSTSTTPEWVREKITAKQSVYETFQSQLVGGPVSYFMYMPADYDRKTDQRFPVMYWLHGIGGAQTGVPQIVDRYNRAIEAGKIPPMCIVFVNGVRDSFYCDTADGKIPVESVIMKELIPHIDATYRTIANRKGRIIEGFSMGGFGAAHLAFKYPEQFGALSVLDGALLDVGTMETRHAALFQRIFANNVSKFVAEDPNQLAEKHREQIRDKMQIRIAVGAIVGSNQAFHQRLDSLKIPHDYRELGVGHSHQAVYDMLADANWEFYNSVLK